MGVSSRGSILRRQAEVCVGDCQANGQQETDQESVQGNQEGKQAQDLRQEWAEGCAEQDPEGGEVTPIEVMCHMPAVCEEKGLPYVYTPSRQDLGTAMGVKRGCLMVMVREHEDYKELFDDLTKEITDLPPVVGVGASS